MDLTNLTATELQTIFNTLAHRRQVIWNRDNLGDRHVALNNFDPLTEKIVKQIRDNGGDVYYGKVTLADEGTTFEGISTEEIGMPEWDEAELRSEVRAMIDAGREQA